MGKNKDNIRHHLYVLFRGWLDPSSVVRRDGRMGSSCVVCRDGREANILSQIYKKLLYLI